MRADLQSSAVKLDKLVPLEKDIQAIRSSLDDWRPQIDAQVSQLQATVRELQDFVQFPNKSPVETPRPTDGHVFTKGVSPPIPDAPTKQAPLRGIGHTGPVGHHVDLTTRGLNLGASAMVTPPAKGTTNSPQYWNQSSPSCIHDLATPCSHAHSIGSSGSAPNRPELPVFDGDNPKWWKKNCEKYFIMFHTPMTTWKDYATMYFTGQAKMWLQSVETKIESMTWEEFCEFVCLRFGKLQYQSLIRRLTHVKQVGSVQGYIEKFNILMHQMLAHNPNLDPEIFTTTFVDGLKLDIRRVVLIQRPVDLDIAGSLALLQEEVLEDTPPQEYPKQDLQAVNRANLRTAVPWSPPVSTKAGGVVSPEARRPSEPTRVSSSTPSTGTNKLNTLRAYRRARGLCFKCGEKWDPQHQCSQTVQLHVVEELLDMLNCEELPKALLRDQNLLNQNMNYCPSLSML